jgi:hypothetical protein
MGLKLGNSLKQPSYGITGVDNKLYDLDALENLKNRASDGALALEYQSELKTLMDKVYYEVSLLASSRALYEINLKMNQEYGFPNPLSAEYSASLGKYISENFGTLYNKAYDLLVDEVVSETDADGMLLYLKERGFHLYADDVKKYLFNETVSHPISFTDALEFISNSNNSVIKESGIFVKTGNALYEEVVENIPETIENEE